MKTLREMMDLIESAQHRFDEPLSGWHIVYRNSGNPVHGTPSFETQDQAQKYLMTRMFADHHLYKVVHTAGVGVAEGQGNLAKALDSLGGSWTHWYPVDSHDPNIEKYEWDDGEGGFYSSGSVEHNLKTGQIEVHFSDEEDGQNVDGVFNSIGDAMRALRGGYPASHGGRAPNFDRLGQRKPHGPDDLRKTDRTGRKGTIGGGFANQLKGSIQANRGRHGPKGVLPEEQVEESTPDALAKIDQLFRK